MIKSDVGKWNENSIFEFRIEDGVVKLLMDHVVLYSEPSEDPYYIWGSMLEDEAEHTLEYVCQGTSVQLSLNNSSIGASCVLQLTYRVAFLFL